MSGMWSSKMASLLNEEETQKKAAKWDSLMKWIKESSETYDSDCDNGRDVDTIWDKLDSLDYQELNSKDLKIKVLDKEQTKCETDKCDMVGLCNEDKCYWESEEKTVNDCLHKYECGCDKQTCMEMDGEEWDCTDTLCGNEYCKHYYDKRNDNCNCNGNDCPYCNNEKEDEILYLLKSNCV